MRSTAALQTENDPAHPPSIVPSEPGGLTEERRSEMNVELCECMIDIAAALFNVPSKELRQTGRTSLAASRVRQIAMYVTHVMFRMSMSEVGRGFGRDRTTVLHACHLVEDMRDDADFDALVSMTERVATAALRQRSGA